MRDASPMKITVPVGSIPGTEATHTTPKNVSFSNRPNQIVYERRHVHSALARRQSSFDVDPEALANRVVWVGV
jgi:hypothetical protein